MMNRTSWLLLALLMVVVCHGNVTKQANIEVVGYFPEWRYRFLDDDHQERLKDICDSLTQLILFSLEVDPSGNIVALDRWPNDNQLANVRKNCADTKIIVCFGGNSRSNGFGLVLTDPGKRSTFVSNVIHFMESNNLDGVDWNWEYPSTIEEWQGLREMTKQLRNQAPKFIQTMAYYPDSRQEQIMSILRFPESVDLMHAMSYDQPTHHSTYDFALKTVERAKAANLPLRQVTLGLPFYGRHIVNGEWKTYHDIAKLAQHSEHVADQYQGFYFNSPATIAKKVQLALDQGFGGLMIWESGQDTEDAVLHKTIRQTIQANRNNNNNKDEL